MLFVRYIMNILAHLYLSNGINQVMLGNYMGDFVKGKQYLHYSQAIQEGIMLHRKIDTYTDMHPIHKTTRDRLRSGYGLHSGIVVDIIYDHFLAANWHNYHPDKLEIFVSNVYTYLNKHMYILPHNLGIFTPIMIKNNWLVSYKSLDGILNVLRGMARRTSLPEQSAFAKEVIVESYQDIAQEFGLFFDDLKKAVDLKII